MDFAAIDFETADHGRDSACSVGVVVVRGGKIVERVHRLIRPPRKEFLFTDIHGITWRKVQPVCKGSRTIRVRAQPLPALTTRRSSRGN